MKILVFSENDDIIYEMLYVGKSIAKENLETYVLSIKQSKEKINFGADRHIIIKNMDSLLYPYLISNLIKDLHEKYKFDIILIGSTKIGREIAPRLAQLLKVEYLSDLFYLRLEQDKLIGTRYILSGKVIIAEEITSKPFIVTVLPKSFNRVVPEKPDKELEEMEIDTSSIEEVEIIDIKKEMREKVDIESAEVIVSVGKGFKAKDDLKMAFELAELLGGEVGCSRPIAADLKWLSEDRWIGLSGHKVKPKLYIAIGISGQTQHIAGIKDSVIIVAINIDPEAPIFKYADYGIIGDLYEILPKFIDEIKKQDNNF